MLTDGELVSRARSGDQDAFTELYTRHHTIVTNATRKILRKSPHLIEDSVQETFAKAFTKLHQFNDTCEFRTWLFRIANNTALMQYRSTKTVLGSKTDSIDCFGDKVPDNIRSAFSIKRDRSISHFEACKDLELAFSGLSETHRRALTLKYVEGLQNNELGPLLGKDNVCTAKSIVLRGLLAARQTLLSEIR